MNNKKKNEGQTDFSYYGLSTCWLISLTAVPSAATAAGVLKSNTGIKSSGSR